MKKWILLLTLTISSVAFCEIMELDLNLIHKKNSITKRSNSTVKVKLGEPFVIKSQGIEMVLTATEEGIKSFSGNSKSAYSIKSQIFDTEDGKRKLLASPKVMSSLDSPIDIISKDNFGNEFNLHIQAASFID